MFVLMEGLYSDEQNDTIVLTKHFNLLCNDDYLVGGRVIITVFGGW